jgi:hypothetical protein
VPLFYHLVRPGENLPAQLDNVLAHIKVRGLIMIPFVSSQVFITTCRLCACHICRQYLTKFILCYMANYQQSKLPCSAILNCATAGNHRVTYPCLCCFFPLFSDGAVQQYLVVIEVIGEVQHSGERGHEAEVPAAVAASAQVAEVVSAQIQWVDAAQSSQSQRREGRGGGGGRSHASSQSAGTELESRSSSSHTGVSNSRSADTGDANAAAPGVNITNRSNVVGRDKPYGGSWGSSQSRSRDGQSDYTSAENASSSNISAMTWDQSASSDVYDRMPRIPHKISRAARNSPSPENNAHKVSR